MKSFALISIHTALGSSQSFPLAAAQLKAYAEKGVDNPPEIKLFEFTVESSPSEIAEAVLSSSVDAVGFSCYLWNRALISDVCRLLRDAETPLFLFAGGAEATADPRGLKDQAGLDQVITGEGEQSFAELVHGQEHSPNEPLALENSPSPFTPELLKDRPAVLWELSRGCPFKCSFCFESRGQSGVRSYSMERIEQELDLFVSCGVQQVFVLDPTFNYHVDRAKKILKLLQKKAPHIYFYFEVRPEFLDREMASLFSRITCSLQIGLQSAHPSVLKNINRKFNPDSYAEKIALLNNAGVIFGLDLIYGLPGDSYSGFKKSLDYALELLPNHLDIFPLAVLPGTELFDSAGDFGLEFQNTPPYLVTSVPGFFPKDREKTEQLARSCWTFYNDGMAVPWFMSVLLSLEMKPSDFLEEFTLWKSRNQNLTIEEMQSQFVSFMLKKKGLGQYSALARDLVSFHSALGRLDNCSSFCIKNSSSLDLDRPVTLSPSVELFTLEHDIYDIWELGVAPLEDLSSCCQKQKTHVLMFLGEEGILPVSLHKETYDLLEAVNGKCSLNGNPSGKVKLSARNREALASLWEEGIFLS